MRLAETLGVEGDEGGLPKLDGEHAVLRAQRHPGGALKPVEWRPRVGMPFFPGVTEKPVAVGRQAGDRQDRVSGARSTA